jgi:hypothetical protein
MPDTIPRGAKILASNDPTDAANYYDSSNFSDGHFQHDFPSIHSSSCLR